MFKVSFIIALLLVSTIFSMTKKAEEEIEDLVVQFFGQEEMIQAIANPNGVCSVCKNGVDFVRQFVLKKYGKDGFYFFLTKICGRFMDEDICYGAIHHYGDTVLDNLILRGIDSDRICTTLKVCNEPIPFITVDDYAKRVLADKPQTKKVPIDHTAKEIKIVQVTDVHLDLEYKEGTIVDCGRPLCCHAFPDNSTKGKTLSGKYGSLGNCDASPEILHEFSVKVKELNPDFVMYTGDNIAHSVWNVELDDVLNATKISVDIMSKELGDIPIYPAVGNHDVAPVDQFKGTEKEYLRGFANIFKKYLTDDAYDTLSKYGYYTMLYKNTKLRIVSLNCLACDSFNWNLLGDPSKGKPMFDWLEGVLASAEKNGEIVHIIDHIPMSSSQHAFNCAGRLKVLLDRYQNIIKAYYSGHTHKDHMTVIREYNSTKPIHINHISSSLTTYTNTNPSFRMYLVDSNTLQIKDFEQYRFNLTLSNQIRQPVWEISFKGAKLYNVTDLTDVEGLANINIAGDYIIKKYTDTDYGKTHAYDEETIKGATCDFLYDDYLQIMKCKNIKPGFSEEYLHYVLNVLQGEWREDK